MHANAKGKLSIGKLCETSYFPGGPRSWEGERHNRLSVGGWEEDLKSLVKSKESCFKCHCYELLYCHNSSMFTLFLEALYMLEDVDWLFCSQFYEIDVFLS